MFDQQAYARLGARLADTKKALAGLKLKPWATEVLLIVPQERPEDFAHFVHFLEALAVAMGHWEHFCLAQGVVEEEGLKRAGDSVLALAQEARLMWDGYKRSAGLHAQSAAQ